MKIVILTRKRQNCAGTAFVQGDSAGGAELINRLYPTLNPISTEGGGGVFHPEFAFCLEFFVLDPISPRFGIFSYNLI